MQEQQQAAQTKSLAEVRSPSTGLQDHKIDMFSLRGFELAQRIAKAYATSDSVPACYRTQILKKDKNGETWVDNPAAIGNCLVAIETAQAIGMSITAVMQNTNMIEGRQSWSGQFKIGAANSSHRFTPMRFDLKYPGKIKATYKEKDGWNKEKNKYNMIEHTIELDNIVCVAWCLPYGMAFPAGVTTMDQARAAGLPVIEGPPVSMKLAVEEGWYAKPGSKWQTEMKHKMLTTRAGAWFSDIHAPDIVMGMGRTTEELQDMSDVIDIERQPDGSYAAKNLDELRGTTAKAESKVDKHPEAETVVVKDNQPEEPAATQQAAQDPVDPSITQETNTPYHEVLLQLKKATDLDKLAEAADLIKIVNNEGLRIDLAHIYKERMAELNGDHDVKPNEQAKEPTRRARRASTAAPE